MALETPTAAALNDPTELTVKKQLPARAVIDKIHIKARRKAEISNPIFTINEV